MSHPLPGVPAICVYDPTAHHEVSHVMLLGRTMSLIVTRWYVMLVLSIEYCWCAYVTNELWTVMDEFSYQSNDIVVAMSGMT
jgi:hypothetical protein